MSLDPPPPPAHEAESSKYASMIRSWPEYGLLPDDAARKEVLAQLQQSHFVRNPWFYLYGVSIAVIGASGVPLIYVASTRLSGWTGLPHWLFAAAAIVLILVIYYLGIGLLWQRTLRNRLRQLIRQRGIPVCLACGYDCRGIVSERCPECGKAITKVEG